MLHFLLLVHTTLASFDFGGDCGGGSGSFRLVATEKKQLIDVGVIPTGTFSLRVELEAAEDLDIALFDVDDTSTYDNGQAVVQWCPQGNKGSKLNCGVLGMDSKEDTQAYAGMTITYSGYGGKDGQAGHEYIVIEGMTTRRLMMRAYAFEAGAAKVNYAWGRGYGGVFMVDVPLKGSLLVGDIPTGVTGLTIALRAGTDVDVQLYDLDDTSQFRPGQAIIGCCNTKNCNYGALTSADWIQGEYQGLTYAYSGWNGVQGGGKGDEQIKVLGTTTRRLRMTIYGYKAGQAEVTYQYTTEQEAASPTPRPIATGPFVWPLYSQQCRDDAGPMWEDDEEISGAGRSYHDGSTAQAVLQDGQCAGPVRGACEARANAPGGGGVVTPAIARAAYLEGPLQCGGQGWFCRILADERPGGVLQGDTNFQHCNRTGEDYREDGHCHGSDDDDTFYWWTRDHWHRDYSGCLHCCCNWAATEGVVHSFDYRAPLQPGENKQCRDANEEHNGPSGGTDMSKGYDAGCNNGGAPVVEPPQCWDVTDFAFAMTD